MEDLMLKIDNVTKQYRLGQIGGTTLRDELQRKMAKLRKKEDPTKKIGAKDYNIGDTFLALNGVSFDVKKGERVGIIGHNGAGKSTLLKLISRVTAPTDGTISMNGRIASMLEVGTGFHAELTGRENIYMNGAILGMTKKEIDAKIEDIIEFSECRKFIDTPVKRYSSGMYVKLAFSVAAHLDSEIMIMDEVLAVGDMAFQKKCLDKMNDVSRKDGRTILYVSHNMNTIRQLCDRVVVLDHGKVVFDGGVEEGIEIYLGINGDLQTHYDYSNAYHNKGNGMANLKSLDVLSDKTSFISGEPIKVKINYDVDSSIKDMLFRFEIEYQNGQKSGTSITSGNVLNNKGEAMLTLDSSLFVDGLYNVDIVAFNFDEYGNSVMFDAVYPGFSFKIDNSLNESLKHKWSPQYWGSVKLPYLIVD